MVLRRDDTINKHIHRIKNVVRYYVCFKKYTKPLNEPSRYAKPVTSMEEKNLSNLGKLRPHGATSLGGVSRVQRLGRIGVDSAESSPERPPPIW